MEKPLNEVVGDGLDDIVYKLVESQLEERLMDDALVGYGGIAWLDSVRLVCWDLCKELRLCEP